MLESSRKVVALTYILYRPLRHCMYYVVVKTTGMVTKILRVLRIPIGRGEGGGWNITIKN